MKKILTLIIVLACYSGTFAQFTSDLIVYNPFGDDFILYIGKNPVNMYPTNKVAVNDLQPGVYLIKTIFNKKNIPPVIQTVPIQANSLISCTLKRNQSGIYSFDIKQVILYTKIQNNIIPEPSPNPPPQPPAPTGNCDKPMDNATFTNALSTIKNQSFESDKLTVAKQIASSNCLTSKQIKKIIKIFDFEDTKLDFAKFAYSHTFDPQNYFIINDAFNYSSSIQKLNKYIQNLKK